MLRDFLYACSHWWRAITLRGFTPLGFLRRYERDFHANSSGVAMGTQIRVVRILQNRERKTIHRFVSVGSEERLLEFGKFRAEGVRSA